MKSLAILAELAGVVSAQRFCIGEDAWCSRDDPLSENEMIEVQRHLQGQLLDRRFPLIQYLGGTEHSSVFLTEYEYAEGRTHKAAIKLVEALPGHAEEQLIRWRLAARFSHRNLLRIFEMDRCKVDGAPMLYVAMEYAEESLADTLLERPLTTVETHDLLGTILDVLGYIHSKGFVHGHIQPSNILAIGDQLKISSDGICRIEEFTERGNGRTRYSAPECATGAPTTASDVWSFGMLLVECLSGPSEKLGAGKREGISVPMDLQAPFLEMARHCLIPEPQRRWDVAELKARLQRKITPEPVAVPPVPKQSKQSKTVPKKRYTVGLSAAGVIAAVILIGYTVIHRSTNVNGAGSKPAEASVAQSSAAPAKSTQVAAAQPPRLSNGAKAPEVRKVEPATTDALQPVSTGELVRGDVLHRVMPNVPRDASDTIWGTVRVAVRVSVDPSGNVVGAKFDSEGPSRYFARLSMTAAQEWKFRPPSVNGTNAPSEWVIRFGYTKTESKANAVEQKP